MPAGGMHAMHTPPVNRMTDVSENITLPQTSFAGGNDRFLHMKRCIFYLSEFWFLVFFPFFEVEMCQISRVEKAKQSYL